MHIDPDEELVGYRQVQIRDLLQKANMEPGNWRLSLIEEGLNTSRDEAIRLAKELESRSLIRESGTRIWKRSQDDFQREELVEWELTDKGRRFAKASTDWISRDEAKKIICRLRQRIEQANQNPEFTYTISRALVFGSYIATDNHCLSDVDIAVEFAQKERDRQKQEAMEEACRRQAEASGKLSSFQEWQAWPKREIYYFLQEEIGHLDFDNITFVVEKKLLYKELYLTTDETLTLVCG